MVLANPRQASGKFEFKKRVKFGLSKKRIKKLLEELDLNIRELERFADHGEKLEQRSKGAWKTSLNWERLRQGAEQLHGAVTTWNCPCQTDHATNLGLEQRLDITKSKRLKRGNGKDDISFSVSFTSFDMATLEWREAEVRIEPKQEMEDIPEISRVSTRSSTLVSFDIDPPQDSRSIKSKMTMVGPTLLDIDDMCSTIKGAPRSASRLGFSLSENGRLRGVYVADGEAEAGKAPFAGTVSLAELLLPAKAGGPKTKLSRRDRYSLAVVIASSTLQLCSTSWLSSARGSTYSTSDILFVRTADSAKPFDIARPYLKQPHIDRKVAGNEPAASVFASENTTLLALALILLELYFGERHDEHAAGTGAGVHSDSMSSVFAALATAQRWVTAERENLSAAFLQATSHCLRCFADPLSSLKDGGLSAGCC